jgi:hypothetical protein
MEVRLRLAKYGFLGAASDSIRPTIGKAAMTLKENRSMPTCLPMKPNDGAA